MEIVFSAASILRETGFVAGSSANTGFQLAAEMFNPLSVIRHNSTLKQTQSSLIGTLHYIHSQNCVPLSEVCRVGLLSGFANEPFI